MALQWQQYSGFEVLLGPLRDLLDVRGRAQEALGFYRSAREALGKDSPASLRAVLARVEGQAALWLGKFAEAQTALEQAQQQLPVGSHSEELRLLGVIAYQTGRPEQAEQYLLRALQQAEPNSAQQAECLNVLGLVYKHRGQHTEAQQYFSRALSLQETLGNAEGVAIALNNLANLAEAMGRDDQAAELYRRALGFFEQLGHRQAVAVGATNLGYLALKLGHLAEARTQSLLGLSIKRALGVQRGQVVSLVNLGEIEAVAGQPWKAWDYFREALQLGTTLGAVPLVLEAMAGMVGVLEQLDQQGLAWQVRQCVAQHPAASPEARRKAGLVAGETGVAATSLEVLIAQLYQQMAQLQSAS